MNVKNLEEKEKSTVALTVEAAPEEFEKEIDVVYKKNRGMISVPGFRKGKAPRKIIENLYGTSVFYEDAMEGLIPKAVSYAITEKGLNTVGYPSVDNIDIAEDKTVTLTFTIAVYPTITVKDYKGIEAEKKTVEVTESDIDAEIEKVRYQNARIETIDNRPVINGDTVNIDYCGTLDGVAFEGGTAENHELKIGSKTFIPGFEEKLQGMMTGEERDLDLTFPEDYREKSLAGKAVVFHVKVNEIKCQVMPEVDDEFVKDVSEFDTVEQYREHLKEEVRLNKEAQAHSEFENNVLDKLAELVEGEIPDALGQRYIDNNISNMEQSLSQYGMSFDQYLTMMGQNREAFEEQMRPQADKNAKVALALEKIAELENFEITAEDIEDGYKEMADMYGMPIEDIKKEVQEKDLTSDLKIRKANRFVVDNAVAVAPAPKEEVKEEAEEVPAEEL